MCKSILKDFHTRISKEMLDARERIDKAMLLARDGRGLALKDGSLEMVMLYKEIEYLLKNVLEE